MHESLRSEAGLRGLTGDEGPHASCVPARLIIIVLLLEPTEPVPQSDPLGTASETGASFCGLGLQQAAVLGPARTLLPLFCLNVSCSVSASWHSRKPLSKRSMKVSEVISTPDQGTHKETQKRNNKMFIFENMHKEI